jgi:4-aminobutyrate aminotransferase-like enzyme
LNLVDEASRKGGILFDALHKLQSKYSDLISNVLGKGLIAAVLFKNPVTNNPDGLFTSRVAERCMQKGLLVVHTGRESIKIGPPLTITDEALLEGISVLDEAITEILQEIVL